MNARISVTSNGRSFPFWDRGHGGRCPFFKMPSDPKLFKSALFCRSVWRPFQIGTAALTPIERGDSPVLRIQLQGTFISGENR
jgi:hypothetical protein